MYKGALYTCINYVHIHTRTGSRCTHCVHDLATGQAGAHHMQHFSAVAAFTISFTADIPLLLRWYITNVK
jgi:hypothetical protein